jgi:F0F1-type ATP synthase assembly protein I
MSASGDSPAPDDHANGAEMSDPPPSTKPLPSAVAFAGMGTTAAGCVAAGVVLGIVADNHWHTSPALLIVGLVVGSGAAVASVVGQIKRFL